MRARDQVWSPENEAEATEPQPEPPPPKQSPAERLEPPAEVPQPPTTPTADPAPEKMGQAPWLPCVHMLEAFFAALANPAPDAMVPQEGETAEQPVAAFAAVAVGSLLFYQQDRAARKADERQRQTSPAAGS